MVGGDGSKLGRGGSTAAIRGVSYSIKKERVSIH
jgi:hypothetical protein